MSNDSNEEDVPTAPELPTLRCPECRGTGTTLQTVEVGTRYLGGQHTCPLCRGQKLVDRRTFVAWRATRAGRPSRPPQR